MRPFNPDEAAQYPTVIGIDEAGRGALCGPVVVSAVWFDPVTLPANLLSELDDSKRLSRGVRERLVEGIVSHGRVSLAAVPAPVIDRIGIRNATLVAMARAAVRLGIEAPVLVDGRDVPRELDLPCEAVIRGDSKIPQIAAASIMAKTTRDRLMRRLSVRYPGYCWERNVGYGTRDHLEGLAHLGPTRHHRRSFAPVLQLSLDSQLDASGE
jgi:ribonuclease HII